jgi:hypothetical protein
LMVKRASSLRDTRSGPHAGGPVIPSAEARLRVRRRGLSLTGRPVQVFVDFVERDLDSAVEVESLPGEVSRHELRVGEWCR